MYRGARRRRPSEPAIGSFGGNQLEADQTIAAAQIQQAMGENRRPPGRVLHQLALCFRIDDLHPRDLFVLFWIDSHEQQFAVFAEAEEVTVNV